MTPKPPTKSAGPKTGGASSIISPARREAFAILLAIETTGERNHGHSDDLLRSPRVSALSPQDRNLCTTLVMGTLRWQILLDHRIQPLLAKPNARLDPEVRIALRLGALQLLFLDRIPTHAAVSESVALAKSAGHKFAAGMVNAVLRKLAAQPRPLLEPAPNLTPAQLAEVTAHPAWLVERWAANYGPETARAICLHGQRQPELNIRVSSNTSSEFEAQLAEQGIVLERGAILTSARRVISGDIAANAVFQSGQIRIQDEGSQLVAELAGHGANILDCCAAPGGKTLILAERNPQARITACELNPARFAALRKRITEAETQNPVLAGRIEVRQADATELAADAGYDLVLADVPCSGTGTLGRNPEIRHRLELADLARHHQRQCAILLGALRAAGNGSAAANAGPVRVIYSTCSLEAEENGEVIAEVLKDSPDWQQVSLANAIDQLREEGRLTQSGAESLLHCIAEDGSLTLLPGRLGPDAGTDGFFIVMLEKRQ